MNEQHRLSSLDGLRGLAAVVVMLTHVLIASQPRLAAAYGPGPVSDAPSLGWWLIHTPLHVFWAGQEFVIVFFVLSGFVLTLPVATGQRFSAWGYYPRRALRLYVPVCAAVVLAAVLHAAVSRPVRPGGTFWLDQHADPLGLADALRSVSLVIPAHGWAYLPVLWSLRWEVIFSAALPAFLLIAVACRRVPWVPVLLSFAVILLSGTHQSAHYLPSFMLGSVLATQLAPIGRVRDALAPRTGRNTTTEGALLTLAVVLLTAGWWFRADRWITSADTRDLATHLQWCAITAGAAIAVLLPLVSGRCSAALRHPVMQWTGQRSFSLYIVHEAVVVTVAFALGASLNGVLLLLIGVPLALLTAEAFYRLVELPSHRLARKAGDAARERVRREAAADAAAP
jgi:peptidoglycan/LPS O-acetylase OafA/YrhL